MHFQWLGKCNSQCGSYRTLIQGIQTNTSFQPWQLLFEDIRQALGNRTKLPAWLSRPCRLFR